MFVSCSMFVFVSVLHTLQEMLHFARGRSPGKMQKALAIGRLPGVLPGAESPANLLIANEYARALVPGKFAPSTSPESNFSAYNLSGVTAICEGFAPGILSGLKLQFAKGFPGITSSKFARS